MQVDDLLGGVDDIVHGVNDLADEVRAEAKPSLVVELTS